MWLEVLQCCIRLRPIISLDQLLMELQKLVLVVLQKLKVAFQRAFSNTSRPRGSFFAWPSVALLCIKTRSAIATGHFPLQPLQQEEVSVRTNRSFNQKLRRSILELKEIKSINYAMCTTMHAKEILRRVARDACRPAYQINSTIHRPLHNSHYVGMKSCISCHY